jgi:uncharacterized protein HemY
MHWMLLLLLLLLAAAVLQCVALGRHNGNAAIASDQYQSCSIINARTLSVCQHALNSTAVYFGSAAGA